MVSHPRPPSPEPTSFAGKVAVLMDDRLEMYWDRGIDLTAAQRAGVDALEKRLRQGFTVDGVSYREPDLLARVQFAASMIPQALSDDREAAAATALAYVCSSLPDLRQIRYRNRGDGHYDIALVTDRDYAPDEQPVRLHRPSVS